MRGIALFLSSIASLAVITGALPLAGLEDEGFPQLDGYEEMVIPEDNPMTPEKVELGRALFSDKRLSGDNSVACETCHQERFGMTPGAAPPGAYGTPMDRACPSLWNVGYQQGFYWEGGGKTLEDAVRGVWLFNLVTREEGRPTMDDIAARFREGKTYPRMFDEAFGEAAKPELIVKALATYLRTLVPKDAAWFRFYRGDKGAFQPSAQRGWEIFDGKAGCTNCHSGILLTDLQYHNVGIDMAGEKPFPGRYVITKREQDFGAYKTPSLLDVSVSPPYFHDNSVETLEEAVDQMLGGGLENEWLDRGNLKPVKLTPEERSDLLAFLRALRTD